MWIRTLVPALLLAVASLLLVGCGGGGANLAVPTRSSANAANEVNAERAKLSPADRTLVDAQEWCVVNTDERLGGMGPPLKLDIKGQAVFVCCQGCKRKAEADPDKTLKTLTELKTKKAAEAGK